MGGVGSGKGQSGPLQTAWVAQILSHRSDRTIGRTVRPGWRSDRSRWDTVAHASAALSLHPLRDDPGHPHHHRGAGDRHRLRGRDQASGGGVAADRRAGGQVRLSRHGADAAVRAALRGRLRQHPCPAPFHRGQRDPRDVGGRSELPGHSRSGGLRPVADAADGDPDAIGHSPVLRDDGPDAGRRRHGHDRPLGREGVPFEFEGMQILAEHVEIYDSPQETGADERLRLGR